MASMNDAERERQAKAVLARAARDTEALGHSSLAQRAAVHFTGRDAAAEGLADDPLEVWGRRIGRAFSVVAAIGLTWWLGFQLGWW